MPFSDKSHRFENNSPLHRRLPTSLWLMLASLVVFLLAGLCVGCGGSEIESAAESSAGSSAGSQASEPASGSSGIQAAKAAGTVDTPYFTTVLPEGWEVLADDMDKMGLMTLSEKGTGGAQGVYLKFEGGGNFTGDPMQAIEKFSKRYDGTPAESVTRNGIEWARTSYTYNGIQQSLNIASHNGYKVTFTVMGRGYDADPGVKAVFDSLQWK